MTRRLLLAFAEAHIHGSAWVGLALILAIVLPFAMGYDLFAAIGRGIRAERTLSQTFVTCEDGCPPTDLTNAVLRCSECGLAWRTRRNAFEPCPQAGCGAVAHCLCACGLPLLNEIYEDER